MTLSLTLPLTLGGHLGVELVRGPEEDLALAVFGEGAPFGHLPPQLVVGEEDGAALVPVRLR